MEAPKKGIKVLEVFTDFEQCFAILSAQDQTILMPDKVAMFLRAVDGKDHNLRILPDDVTTESGLMEQWDDVRSNVS